MQQSRILLHRLCCMKSSWQGSAVLDGFQWRGLTVLATWAHGFNLGRAFAYSVASGAMQEAIPRCRRTNRTMIRAIINAVCSSCPNDTSRLAEPQDNESLSESADFGLHRVRDTEYGRLTTLLINVADSDVIFTGTIIGRVFIIDIALNFHLWNRKMRLRTKRH
jgi:hypothetical protein